MGYQMSFVDPPGTYIQEELEARGWSQRDLAYVLGMKEQQLNRIIRNNSSITPDVARQLGDAFDVPADFFANLQKLYDLSRAKEPDPAIRKRAQLQSVFPIRSMIARGWIEDTEASLLQLQVERFFEGEIPAFAAKRTNYDDDPPEQIAWLFRVRQLAKAQIVASYDPGRLHQILPQLKALAIEPEGVREAADLLRECGVRIVFVESLAGAKIDGVCTWLDDSSPIIGMSVFHDRMDNFWFVLRHEIEHVLRGHGKAKAILDNLEGEAAGEGEAVTKEERVANAAAADFCVPKDKMRSFFLRKNPYFSERDVVGFAAVLQTHPALVVGQLHHLTKKYTHFRKFLHPIRRYLLEEPNAIVDGWGRTATADL